MKPTLWGGPGAVDWTDQRIKWFVFYNTHADMLVTGCLVRGMWYMESDLGYNYYFPEELNYTGHIKIGAL